MVSQQTACNIVRAKQFSNFCENYSIKATVTVVRNIQYETRNL